MVRDKKSVTPPKVITVGGNKYEFGGDIRNTETGMRNMKEFYKTRGLKVVFRADPSDKKSKLVYVSRKILVKGYFR